MPMPTEEVFTAAEASAAGLSRSALAYGLRTGNVIRIHRGVYTSARSWRGVGFEAISRRATLSATAAVRLVSGADASHTSAALLAGLPVWRIPRRPCLTVRPRYSGDTTCAHLHRASVPPGHRVADARVPRLSTSRTILDIAREHGLDDAIVVGDAALRRRMTDADRLAAVAGSCAGWPGIRRARHLLALLDERSESPLESVSRLRLAATPVPPPELQPDILASNGLFLGRPDMYWDEYAVAGEVDGLTKYQDDPAGTFMWEKHRQEAMEEVGIIFVRWDRADLEELPRLVARLTAAFARGARRPRTDRTYSAVPLPRRYTPIL